MDLQPTERRPDGPHFLSERSVAFLLTDLSCRPIYVSEAALRILSFPDELHDVAFVQGRLRTILHAELVATPSPPEVEFLSGKRHYVCRPFVLEVTIFASRQTAVVFLLERQPELGHVSEFSRRFHLSPRESETVQHLLHGLTTKEVAQKMNVSPHTVKQYVRLVMIKVGVTTRSGIVGKLFYA